MKTTTLAAVIALFPLIAAGAARAEAPRTVKVERPSSVVGQTLKPTAALTALTVASATRMAGDKKPFEAVLTLAGKPLAGKRVKLWMEGKNGSTVPGGKLELGAAMTDDAGKARVVVAFPELKHGDYTLVAAFEGEVGLLASRSEADLKAVKAATELRMKFFRSSAGKGSPHGVAIPSLRYAYVGLVRKHDQQALARPLLCVVNGSAQTLGKPNQQVYQVSIPQSGNVTVSAAYFGDDVYTSAGGKLE